MQLFPDDRHHAKPCEENYFIFVEAIHVFHRSNGDAFPALDDHLMRPGIQSPDFFISAHGSFSFCFILLILILRAEKLCPVH